MVCPVARRKKIRLSALTFLLPCYWENKRRFCLSCDLCEERMETILSVVCAVAVILALVAVILALVAVNRTLALCWKLSGRARRR